MSYIFIILLLSSIVLCTLIARADWRRRIIPDVYLWPLMLIGLVIVSEFSWPVSVSESVAASVMGYALGLGIGMAFNKILEFRVKSLDRRKPGQSYKKPNNNQDLESLNSKLSTLNSSIGLGDVKLLAVGGIWLGPTGLAVAIVASCICGIIWGKIKGQKYIPFAPFFFAGAIISLIYLFFMI